MQGVEDGEEVCESSGDRPPAEEGQDPGEAQQEGEAGDNAKVVQESPGASGALVGAHLTDLEQNHSKHCHVAQQDQDNKGHDRDIKRCVILHPAAGEYKWIT